jgi:hypothetical protein
LRKEDLKSVLIWAKYFREILFFRKKSFKNCLWGIIYNRAEALNSNTQADKG